MYTYTYTQVKLDAVTVTVTLLQHHHILLLPPSAAGLMQVVGSVLPPLQAFLTKKLKKTTLEKERTTFVALLRLFKLLQAEVGAQLNSGTQEGAEFEAFRADVEAIFEDIRAKEALLALYEEA